jgi:hypothetical protein
MQVLQLRFASFRMTVFDRRSFALRSCFGVLAERVECIGAMKYVGILRFAQNDELGDWLTLLWRCRFDLRLCWLI